MKPERNVYAVYKGDAFVDVGTMSELSERLGMTKKELRYISNRVYVEKRATKNAKIAFKVEDCE